MKIMPKNLIWHFLTSHRQLSIAKCLVARSLAFSHAWNSFHWWFLDMILCYDCILLWPKSNIQQRRWKRTWKADADWLNQDFESCRKYNSHQVVIFYDSFSTPHHSSLYYQPSKLEPYSSPRLEIPLEYLCYYTCTVEDAGYQIRNQN